MVAVLFATVELRIISVPPASLSIAPPFAVATLSERVELETVRLPELSMAAPSAALPWDNVTPVMVAVTPLLTTSTPTRLLPLIVNPDVEDPSIASGVAMVLLKTNGAIRLIVVGVENTLDEKTTVLAALPGLAGLTFTLTLAQFTAVVIVPTSGPREVVVTRYDELAS